MKSIGVNNLLGFSVTSNVRMYLCHLLVGGEELLVLGVLEVVLLEVGPQELDALRAGGLLLSDDVGQVGGQLHGLGQSLSFRHVEKICGRLKWKNL